MLSDNSKKVLEIIVTTVKGPLLPAIGLEGVTYKKLIEGGVNTENVISILDKLSENGYLKRSDVDHAIFCPKCRSPHVYSKYGCPITDSIHLLKISLIEHPQCGNIGERKEYKKGDRLVCPQCGTYLKDVNGKPPKDGSRYDWKEIGSAYECEVGGTERFQKPEIIHYCQVCDEVFDYRTAHYLPLFGYEATEKAYALMKVDPEINNIQSMVESVLGKNGFKSERSIELEGVSGSKHYVSISSRKGETEIIFDITKEGDPDKLVSLLGKKIDLKIDEAILISGIKSDKLRALGESLNVEVIVSGDPEFNKSLESILEKLK